MSPNRAAPSASQRTDRTRLGLWLAKGLISHEVIGHAEFPRLGQVYIVARLWVKLVFWASETSLFQSRLAHAGYVARPEPVWPESPMAEAMQRGWERLLACLDTFNRVKREMKSKTLPSWTTTIVRCRA